MKKVIALLFCAVVAFSAGTTLSACSVTELPMAEILGTYQLKSRFVANQEDEITVPQIVGYVIRFWNIWCSPKILPIT